VVVTVIVVATLIALDIATLLKLNKVTHQLEIADDLAKTALERIATRSQWLLFRDEATVEQWTKLNQRVESLLLEARREYKGTSHKAEIESVLSDVHVVGEDFNKLQENWSKGQSGALDPATVKKVEDQLVSEMMEKARELASLNFKLASESGPEQSKAIAGGVTMNAIIVFVLALVVVLGALVINFSVLRRIDAVQEGTKRVTAGDLDFRIDYSGRSEVAELARLFNEMTDRIERKSKLVESTTAVLKEAFTCETETDITRTCLSFAERMTGGSFGFIGLLNESGRMDTKSLSEPGWKACRMPESEAVVLINDMEVTS
jgi:HAMP domain-containing protein